MAEGRLLVVCLCADWCGSCREYRPTFDALAARFASEAEFAWIDIEDESDALGDPDIENFPTLVILAGDLVRFFGPVAPQIETSARLVRNALQSEAGDLASPPPIQLAARVRRVVESRTPGDPE